ncbi:hypothetical protein GGI08_001193 [Coemansia sp. S2]|nr:hypothetical protein GGI08_001193 [Coemansia sp. S2]
MQRTTRNDSTNPLRIVIAYIGTDGCKKASFASHRDSITSLDALLEGERDVDPPEEFDNIDSLVRSQYNDAYIWLANMDFNTPNIVKGCKYILVGKAMGENTAAK